MISTEFLSKLSAVLTTYEVSSVPISMLEKLELSYNHLVVENKYRPGNTITGIQFLDEFVQDYSQAHFDTRGEVETAEKILADILKWNGL